jgi:ATP-dependent DNA ligase
MGLTFTQLFTKSRTGKVRVWRIAVNGNAVITEFGELGGKIQRVTDLTDALNVGKANYKSPEQVAEEMAERLILDKTRQGYGPELPEGSQTITDFKKLPETLSFYKPTNSIKPALDKHIIAGTAWFTRKYDGEMMVIVKHEDGVDIYSRRMLSTHHLEPNTPWVRRFAHIQREVQESDIPPNTILLGEMVADTKRDDRWHVASVLKSLTPKAIDLQLDVDPLHYVIWDVAFWAGEQLIGVKPYKSRHSLLSELGGEWLHPVPVQRFSTKEEALEHATDRGWEGFVVRDPEDSGGDRCMNFRGSPDRPLLCGKLKGFFEDDFIAVWNPPEDGTYGSGKYHGKLGSVALYQFNAAREMIYICDCGNGWTAEFIEANSTPSDWPKVLQVRYETRTYRSRGDDTDALQFPRFITERKDKDLDECVNPEL